ncbi:T9SS type A sorting domain-containing protein [bacterium]|nr:T9SS type A sorting domain-containing protein [bacterium]
MYKAILVITIIIATLSFADWTIPLFFHATGYDTFCTVVFGTASGATDGYDSHDWLAGEPLFGGRLPCFIIDDDSLGIMHLGGDFRSSLDDTIIWHFYYFTPDTTESCFVDWSLSSLPSDGVFELLVTEADTTDSLYRTRTIVDNPPDWDNAINMREFSSASFSSSEMILLRFQTVSRIKDNCKNVEQFPTTILTSPNPFNSSCAIQTTNASNIDIYNLSGELIDNFVVGEKTQAVVWHPNKNLSTGTYFIEVKSDNGDKHVKTVLYLK